MRHSAPIMSDKKTSRVGGYLQHVWIRESPQTRFRGGLEVYQRLPPLNSTNDSGIQVGVSLESDSHGAPFEGV